MRWDCLLLASVRGRVGDTQLIHESLAEVPLPHLSVRIPTPQRVCVDDAYIDEPPCEGRPVLHALPLHSIVLPELINCVHIGQLIMTLCDTVALARVSKYTRSHNSQRLPNTLWDITSQHHHL